MDEELKSIVAGKYEVAKFSIYLFLYFLTQQVYFDLNWSQRARKNVWTSTVLP